MSATNGHGPVVVKVGGSLLDWPELGERLSAYLEARRGERPLVIVGGGAAADCVRSLDRVHHLGDERAHHLALRALDLTAFALAAIVPSLRVVNRLDEAGSAWATGHVPVLAPRLFLDGDENVSDEPLEHSWAVTSDSIAARVAVCLNAAELALLKSAPLPPDTDRARAAELGLVDLMFPQVSRALRLVTYQNFREIGTGGLITDDGSPRTPHPSLVEARPLPQGKR
jgi:aspartokinase-like uncharacterized kinase